MPSPSAKAAHFEALVYKDGSRYQGFHKVRVRVHAALAVGPIAPLCTAQMHVRTPHVRTPHPQDGSAENAGVLRFHGGGGDEYAGEFLSHRPHGVGCHTFGAAGARAGARVCGRWRDGQLHGCGLATLPDGQQLHGQWLGDKYIGDTLACSLAESRRAAEQAEGAAARARRAGSKAKASK